MSNFPARSMFYNIQILWYDLIYSINVLQHTNFVIWLDLLDQCSTTPKFCEMTWFTRSVFYNTQILWHDLIYSINVLQHTNFVIWLDLLDQCSTTYKFCNMTWFTRSMFYNIQILWYHLVYSQLKKSHYLESSVLGTYYLFKADPIKKNERKWELRIWKLTKPCL